MSNNVKINGLSVSFDAAVLMMDDAIREELHSRLAMCVVDQEFADAYCAAHQAKFGEVFTVA